MHRVIPGTGSSPTAKEISQAWGSKAHKRLSRGAHSALWAFLILLHALSTVFLLCSAKLYWLMENEYLDYFAGLLAPARDQHFRVVGAAMGVLGAMHGLQLVLHAGASIFACSPTVQPLKLGTTIAAFIMRASDKIALLVNRALYRWISSRRRWWQPNRSRRIRLSDETNEEAYDRMFALRKTVEIATQVPNAYLYSTLVARPWINHAKVALLVINCWSGFVIHRMLLKSYSVNRTAKLSASIRISAVIVDALLSTATAIVLPGAIFMPYALQFDAKNLTFPDAMLYGDTTFPNLVLENRAFFFMSWANTAMKSMPHVSVFLCLEAIAAMLDSPNRPGPAISTVSPPPQPPTFRLGTKKPIIMEAAGHTLIKAPELVPRSAPRLYRVHRVLLPLFFLVTGGVVLSLHLTAQYGSVTGDMDVMESMCLQRMYPWFAANFSCAVVKFNCYKEGVNTPPPQALGWLERSAVRKFVFMHCAAFIMPPIIREFPSLMGIELWNMTLERWGEDAAVSAELHPTMLFINFAYVNLTDIPAGLLQSPLPERLTDLEFTHTNLTSLPQEVVEPWNGVEIVFIEHSQINPFPSVLMELPVLSELSLIANKFDTMPEDVLLNAASVYFYNLALSQNALRQLPEARKNNFDVSYLALEFTELTELPTWVDTQVWDSVSLGGSPLCASGNDGQLSDVAICGVGDPLGEQRYPTQLLMPFRALD